MNLSSCGAQLLKTGNVRLSAFCCKAFLCSINFTYNTESLYEHRSFDLTACAGGRWCLLTLPLMMLGRNKQGSRFIQNKWLHALNYQWHNKALHSICITFWAALRSCANSLQDGIFHKVSSSRDTLLYLVKLHAWLMHTWLFFSPLVFCVLPFFFRLKT